MENKRIPFVIGVAAAVLLIQLPYAHAQQRSNATQQGEQAKAKMQEKALSRKEVDEAYKATMAQSNDQRWQGFYANIRRYFPDAWKPEYEKYVRILYAPTLSGDWPRLAMVRSIYQQITYLDPVYYDWAHIKVKTLVLGGERDGEDFPAQAKHIADTIPGGQLVLLPGLGHVPHLQAPEVFHRELLRFLR